MERYYITALTYVGAPAASTRDDRCEPEVLQYYTIGTSNVGAKTYTVSAAIVSGGKQAGDSCGTLSITHAGTKSPATSGCWYAQSTDDENDKPASRRVFHARPIG